MDAKPSGFGHGTHQRDDRALSIRAGDMDHRRQMVMRIAKTFQKREAAFKSKIYQFGMKRREPVQRRGSARGVVQAR